MFNIKKIKKVLTGLTALALTMLPLAVRAAEPIGDKIKDAYLRTGQAAGFISSGEPRTFIQILGAYVNGLLGLMGVLFLLLIIYGGFIWMTAAGSEERINKAKRIIMGATIGIGVVLLSMAITMFVLSIFKEAL